MGVFFSTRFVETQLFKSKKKLWCGCYGHLKEGVCAAQLTLLTMDTTMEEACTESHQSEINRKIKANDKLRNILTFMPDEQRSLIYGGSF